MEVVKDGKVVINSLTDKHMDNHCSELEYNVTRRKIPKAFIDLVVEKHCHEGNSLRRTNKVLFLACNFCLIKGSLTIKNLVNFFGNFGKK